MKGAVISFKRIVEVTWLEIEGFPTASNIAFELIVMVKVSLPVALPSVVKNKVQALFVTLMDSGTELSNVASPPDIPSPKSDSSRLPDAIFVEQEVNTASSKVTSTAVLLDNRFISVITAAVLSIVKVSVFV